MNSPVGAAPVAAATFRELRRRPGILLATLAVAALLALLPEICARAVEESGELTLQIALSTISLFLTLVAGLAGLRAGASDGELGAAAEWRATPLGPGAYILGRFVGVAATTAALFIVLVTVVSVTVGTTSGDDPIDVSVAALAAVGTLLCAMQFSALGLLFAAVTTPQLAAVLLVASLVATRTLLPALASHAGALASLSAALPDPARLDLARELAFRRPVDAASATLAFASAAAQTAACLVAASWALGRREA